MFTSAYGGSVDVDFLQLKGKLPPNLGVRLGVERFASGSFGGSAYGSPYLDYNALVRLTIPGETLRFDVLVGYAHHTSDHSQFYPSKGLVKYGGELRWKIAPGVFGLLLKANGTKAAGTGGIGLYCGWDQ